MATAVSANKAELLAIADSVAKEKLIDRAIAKGHTRFEAGAQGTHKIKRGLVPSPIHSVHWLRSASLAAAVRDFLPREALAARREMAILGEQSPFHRGPADTAPEPRER